MKYRNTITGAIFETDAVIAGGNWEEVKDTSSIAPAQEKKRKTSRKTKADAG